MNSKFNWNPIIALVIVILLYASKGGIQIKTGDITVGLTNKPTEQQSQ